MQTKNNPLQILTWLLMAVASCLILWWLRAVLMPFILASVVAYLLLPAVLYLTGIKAFPSGRRLKVPRILAAVLIEILFIVSHLRHCKKIISHESASLPNYPGALESGQGRIGLMR